jgi:hypothetical protein
MKYVIVRLRYYEECFQQTMPEVAAGCHGRVFFCEEPDHAQEIANLLNKCRIGNWIVKSTESLEEVYTGYMDEHELWKYESNLRECIAQEAWFTAKSPVGYVVIPIAEGTHFPVDAFGMVELRLMTPYQEKPNIRTEGFTQEVAAELAEYANLRNHAAHDVSWTWMAIETYKRHWNQLAEVEMASADVVASLLAEAREYMGGKESDHAATK